MGELVYRLGSREVAEWIAEFSVLRPEDQREGMRLAKEEAEREERGVVPPPQGAYQGHGALMGAAFDPLAGL